MIPQHCQILRDAGHEELAKNFFIKQQLHTYLQTNPICDEDSKLDLNPHLIIKHACEHVAQQVRDENFICTTEDVMLMWLTEAVYLGEFLCPVT